MAVRKIVFLLFQKTHLLDLAGPAQVFYEANQLGKLDLEICFAALNHSCCTEQGLQLANLKDPETLYLGKEDFVVIPGIDFYSFQLGQLKEEINKLKPWLNSIAQKGVRVASICSGALILAATGLLDDHQCTTHWKCIEYIQQNYKRIKVLDDRLFVKDRNIYTSAGMTSGMDMSLAIVEELYGPILTAKTAREMVIFLRRDKDHSQQSVYLDFQTHFNSAIHKVQNFMISQPERNPSLEELAQIASMSTRNLTRTFKEVTGHTITEFKHKVKVELVKLYLRNPDITIESIAQNAGFTDPRQLRRIWKSYMGESLRSYRASG